jgi:poly-gamma-glutamate synthesis protein (capsule biosynthesis protein)
MREDLMDSDRKNAPDANEAITLFLCGDVMPARGIDSVLPFSCPPTLHESYVQDARVYVQLAERVNGPIPRPLSYPSIWGHALKVLHERKPSLSIINLETSVSCSDDYWRDKGIHYRMHPKNVALLQAAGIDCSSLANNHSMDWGVTGLIDTLEALEKAGIAHVGAGRSIMEAAAPAIFNIKGRRVLVYGLAATSSGVPWEWAATFTKPGVHLLDELSKNTARRVARLILNERKDEDLVVLSMHWGDNWGYDIPQEQRDFAHELIDHAAVDIVHGHSTHHPKGMEIYRGKLILYGAGDFINDYEGIGNFESFRGDLACMYFVSVFPQGPLQIQIVPVRIKNFQLQPATEEERTWLLHTMQEASAPFSLQFKSAKDESFLVEFMTMHELTIKENEHDRMEYSGDGTT